MLFDGWKRKFWRVYLTISVRDLQLEAPVRILSGAGCSEGSYFNPQDGRIAPKKYHDHLLIVFSWYILIYKSIRCIK